MFSRVLRGLLVGMIRHRRLCPGNGRSRQLRAPRATPRHVPLQGLRATVEAPVPHLGLVPLLGLCATIEACAPAPSQSVFAASVVRLPVKLDSVLRRLTHPVASHSDCCTFRRTDRCTPHARSVFCSLRCVLAILSLTPCSVASRTLSPPIPTAPHAAFCPVSNGASTCNPCA